MAFFRKKADPISARSKELNARISALDAEIRRLSQKVEARKPQPRVRSTAVPQGPTTISAPVSAPREPVFEQLDYQKVKGQPEIDSTGDHYNDLGVRKYDLLGAFRRIFSAVRGSSTANPKLVSYLAAGSIKGLRPLRYEKRIARNRFIFLTIFFFLIVWGVATAIFNQR
jgi:hypothetical protein